MAGPWRGVSGCGFRLKAGALADESSKHNMRTQPTRVETRAVYDDSAIQAHCRRVGAAAVEVARVLGWKDERQRALRAAARSHHGFAGRMKPLLWRLLEHFWGVAAQAPPALDLPGREMAKLLEMSCFFVERWEFLPYETARFEQVVEELRTMARDGFFEGAHVEGLARVPGASVEEVRAVVSELPVFPSAALRAMQLARDPKTSAAQLEQIVGSDPVLAGETLRVANSALYASTTPCRSIRQAVVAIGIPECCRILSAAAFRPLFQSPLMRPLWNHSTEVARIAESLARQSGKVEPEEAFLTGLMHDIGRLALWKLPSRLTARYSALLGHGCEPMFAEVLLCGFDHCPAGREVMRHWGLPDRLAEAVEFHHQPERSDSDLARVLYLAEHLSGAQEDLPSMARFCQSRDGLGLTSEQLCSISSPPPLY